MKGYRINCAVYCVSLHCRQVPSMAGYKVTPVEPLKSGLLCLECKLVLRDPVQTDEGDRLCRKCYEEIKQTGNSEGGVTLGEDETVSVESTIHAKTSKFTRIIPHLFCCSAILIVL